MKFWACVLVIALAGAVRGEDEDDGLVRCPRCFEDCPMGQVNEYDDRGCPTCACVPESEHDRFMRCGPICRMYCTFDFKNNEEGCPICECNPDPCEEHSCKDGQVCKPNRVGSGVWEAVCEEVTPRCLLAACDVECQFGLVVDANGCHTCDCNPSPCATTMCERDHVCKINGENEAECTLQPLCEQAQRGVHLLGQDAQSRGPHGGPGSQPLLGGHHLACTQDGQFQPTQCYHVTGDCWCVDDMGKELEGTRKNVRRKGSPLVCPVNTTTSLHGHVSLQHDLEDLESHLDMLHNMMHDMLSHWLVVHRRYITVIEITPNHADIHLLEVDFVVATDENAQHDLATSSHHFQQEAQRNNIMMQYQGHILKPAHNGVHVLHTYQPMLPPVGVMHREASFYRQHQAALLACFIGITFFLLILTALVKILMSRRRSSTLRFPREEPAEPRDLYKQNLKFSSKLSNVGDEDKKVVLTDAEGMGQEVTA